MFFFRKIITLYRLGFNNLTTVSLYRILKKFGYYRYNPPIIPLPEEAIFSKTVAAKDDKYYIEYFSFHSIECSSPPNWFVNPWNNKEYAGKKHWSNISDFMLELGDIKLVWELSRFSWLPQMACEYMQGKPTALEVIELWLRNWIKQNPFNMGVNWKCGQEASIRVMHLCITASILNQHKSPSDSLLQLIEIHLKRIASTITYAIAQNNNHGTSEAIALYMGGSFLSYHGNQSALKYQELGLKWMENRAKKLISNEGAFSQYSLNYHRVMLDSYSMAEYWRRLFQLPLFSTTLYRKLKSATNWLYQMTQAETGDAPNLGANDGAKLLPLSATDYRDYRPSVQLASVLFCQERAYKTKGDWDMPLHWLNIALPKRHKAPPYTSDFSNSGYSLLRKNKAFVLFNIPRYKFRPSQCDALHVDLWLEGENILRDGGTFSYNAGDDITSYFGGTASHNTVQFDDRDQMPRMSRFLLGAWLKAKEVIPVIMDQKEGLQTAASYQDYKGAYHHRKVTLMNGKLLIKDTVKGFKQKAVLRWRLKPDDWTIDLKENTVTNGKHEIRIQSQVEINRFEIVEGWESRYYLQKTPLPVLEVEIEREAELSTEYLWNIK